MVKKTLRKVGHYLKPWQWFRGTVVLAGRVTRKRLAAGAVTGINLLLLLLIFLMPFFFLPWTVDFFEFNKEVLSLVVTSLLFFFWGLRIWAEKEIRIARTPYDLPVLLFLLAVLAAAVFGRARPLFFTPTPFWTLAALPLFYFAAAANAEADWGRRFLKAYIGSLLFLFPLLLGGALLAARWPWAAPLFALTPAGRPELAQIYFLTGFPVLLYLYKHHFIRQRVGVLLILLVLSLGLSLSNHFTRPFWQKLTGVENNSLPVLSAKDSSAIILASLKEAPFVGQGITSYPGVYTRFRPSYLNKTALWDYRAVPLPLANTWFHLLAVGGLFLFGAVVLLLFAFLRQLRRRAVGKIFYLTAALFFLSLFVTTWSYSFFVLPWLFLSLGAISYRQTIIKVSPSYWVKGAAAVCLTFPWLALFFLGKSYAAEVFYRQAWIKLSDDERPAAYRLLKNAIQFNPDAAAYRRLYIQANLFLAEEYYQKSGGDENARETTQQLIGQAEREVKFLTEVLEPNSVESWEARGGVYRSLIGLVPDAEEEAEAAYLKAAALSPNDPVWPWQLANVYLMLGKNDKALEALGDAAVLKDDWPQIYYSLAMAYDAQKNEAKVLEMLKKLAGVTAPGTPERERALYLLEQRSRATGNQEKGR